MGVYKNNILTPIINSDDIKDILLVGQEYSDEMWYGKENDDDDFGIVYKQIFPYLYIDETQTTVKAYILFDVDMLDQNYSTTKNIKLVIWCLCHKDSMRYRKTGYSGTRVDILADAVERELRKYEQENEEKGKSKFGIGNLHLDSVTRLPSQNSEYYGKQLVFSTSDFTIKKSG